jgi:hypothetical protein
MTWSAMPSYLKFPAQSRIYSAIPIRKGQMAKIIVEKIEISMKLNTSNHPIQVTF